MISLVDSVEFIELHMSGSTETTTSGMLTKGQNIDNCVPFISWYCGNDDFDGNFPDIWFTDVGGPAINAQRTVPNSYDMYIKGYVVEFDPTKVKVYQGNIPTSINYNAETPVTITTGSGTFDQSRTAMKFYYRTNNVPNVNYLNQHLAKGRVNSDGTTISFKKMYNGGTTHYGHYYAFESIDNDFTVHHRDSTLTGGTSYETGVYDWHNTFIIHSYCGDYNGYGMSYSACRAYLWGNSRVAVNKESSSYTSHYNVQTVKFSNSATASGTRYCPKITSYHGFDTSTTARDLDFYGNVQNSDTLTMVVAQNPTRLADTSNDGKGGAFFAVWVTNSGTQYRAERAEAGYYGSPTYYLVDWGGNQIPQYPDTGTNPAPLASGTSFVKSVENISTNVLEHVAVEHLSKGQDVNNCIVFKSGYATNTSNYNQQYRHESMTYFRGNELYLERGNEGWDYPMELSVVEFYPEQVKVQQGTFVIGMNATSTNVTIEEVDRSKTFLVFGHFYGGGEDAWGYHMCRGNIANSTTLTFDRGTAHTYPIMGTWYVAEDLGENWVVSHYNSGFSTFYRANHLSGYNFPVYNTFTLISSKTDTTNNNPDYSTWRLYYHSIFSPARCERISNSYNTQISTQAVKFLDETRVRTHYAAPGLTGTESTETYSPYTSFSGMAVTSIPSNLNGVARTDSNNSSYNTLPFWRVKYDELTNQVIISRNNASYSVNTYHTIFTVAWEGFEHDTGGGANNAEGYFVKSIENYTYTGTTRRKTWEVKGNQDLSSTLPIANYYIGEDVGSDIEHMCFIPHLYPDLGYLHFESFWTPDDGGISVNISLIEFDPAQVKIQRGNIVFWGETTLTATIEEVDVNKAFLIHYVMPSDNVGTTFAGAAVAGKISSSTELNFERSNTTGSVFVYYYVVECLQDQWSVHNGEINNNNSTYYTFDCPITPEHSTISWMSYAHDQTAYYPSYCMFRTYPDHDQRGVYKLVANRQSTSSEVERMNFSSIAFNESLGVYVDHVHYYLGTRTESTTVELGRDYDVNRTVFWPGQMWPVGRVNTTDSNRGPQRGFTKAEFQDPHTMKITRYPDGLVAETWGHYYLIEFPIPSHKVEGVVREKGNFVERTLHLHSTATGELLGETTSSSIDGAYKLITSYSGSTYVVCLDDPAGTVYNGLIETDISPTKIPGSYF